MGSATIATWPPAVKGTAGSAGTAALQLIAKSVRRTRDNCGLGFDEPAAARCSDRRWEVFAKTVSSGRVALEMCFRMVQRRCSEERRARGRHKGSEAAGRVEPANRARLRDVDLAPL